MNPIVISGKDLGVDDVVAVANGHPVALSAETLPTMQRSRDAVEH